MHSAPRYSVPQAKPLSVAIVEDNATARTNLRSHLMGIDNFEVSSYSNGAELKNGLRLNNFDLILMDYHLGQSKNGVEWINSLQERELFKASTGLIFVTSDSMPQTIGQILELHPDFILIKPYTIKSLAVNLAHYLKLRSQILPALQYMSKNENFQALKLIDEKIKTNDNKRFVNDFLKLKGRLLLADKKYPEAISLYSNVLKKSSNVLWAHWGLIKSEFFTGKWEQCQKMLNHLISASLTKDKAYEWMASVAIGKEEFNEAELMLDNIKESELTMQTTRLKVLAYNMQDKHQLAQALLEKKIQSNLSIKDRMIEYALELARFHIQLAESFVIDNTAPDQQEQLAKEEAKKTNLSAARKLIGKAARTANDRQSELQKDYMLALAYIIEGNNEKAQNIIETSGSLDHIQNIHATTMIDAVKVWFGIGQTEKAKEILEQCDNYLLGKGNHIEQLICSNIISDIEETNHLQKDRALQKNESGNALYQAKEYSQALSYFHKAYKMFPGIPAFSLNLLQCMAEIEQLEFQGLYANKLYKELKSVTLSSKNQMKLEHIKIRLGF
ncbi:MAG: CheY-like chemotaxis protein [Patiriisocius sp.]|jgi:CheY-like chemotaxis protein